MTASYRLCLSSILLATGLVMSSCSGDSAQTLSELVAMRAAANDEILLKEEAAIVACMQDEGHLYTSASPEPPISETSDVYQLFVLNGSWLPEQAEIDVVGYGLISSSVEAQAESQETQLTANEEYREQLPEATKSGYDTAMQLCSESSEGSGKLSNALGDELSELISRIDHEVRTDPEVLSAIESWSACMADNGWAFKAPGDPQRAVVEAFNQLPLQERDHIIATDTDTQARRNPIVEASLLRLGTLAELADAEVKVAIADYECQHAGYIETVRSAAAAAETRVRNPRN